MIGISFRPRSRSCPVLLNLRRDDADEEGALPVLGHAGNDVGRDRVGTDVDEAELLVRERRRDRLHRLDHVERRSDDDVEALRSRAGERRLEFRDAARLDDHVVDIQFLDRALHPLVHHVVEGPVAHPGLGGDEGDLDLCFSRASQRKNHSRRQKRAANPQELPHVPSSFRTPASPTTSLATA